MFKCPPKVQKIEKQKLIRETLNIIITNVKWIYEWTKTVNKLYLYLAIYTVEPTGMAILRFTPSLWAVPLAVDTQRPI